ncbi:hypothetical protein AQJ58_28885 [Streptomyces sp. DSM 15324]|nr:hypothetical protein AQJ58_28885 [Streptomyces sp. DSM 15324]
MADLVPDLMAAQAPDRSTPRRADRPHRGARTNATSASVVGSTAATRSGPATGIVRAPAPGLGTTGPLIMGPIIMGPITMGPSPPDPEQAEATGTAPRTVTPEDRAAVPEADTGMGMGTATATVRPHRSPSIYARSSEPS